MWTIPLLLIFCCISAAAGQVAYNPSGPQQVIISQHALPADEIEATMLASVRTSWEQGTAAGAVVETHNPEYSFFGLSPFQYHGTFPKSTLQLAVSAVVRQTSDGRLSQQINDALDGAALDGASAGPAVLLGTYTDLSRQKFWQDATDAQLNFLLHKAPRTSTGAISHRADSKQYWADGVYMGFPFIAAYGAVTSNQGLLMEAYTQCKLYRNALIQPGPTGPLWAHIANNDGTFADRGLWATGNAWAALGMVRVQATILKTPFAANMSSQANNLASWVKEILDGTFRALNPDNLVPNYIMGGARFSDAASSAALASVAYRAAVLRPDLFGAYYTGTADKIREAIAARVDNLGMMSPLVDPLRWNATGTLSTEGQAFGLMLAAAYRDWSGQ